MNNFKKIGMTALAASLVSTSVFAGEVTVAGGASINFENYSADSTAGANAAGTKSFSMGNQLTFTGSGELENGLNVSISFVLDQNDDSSAAGAAYTGGPFDSHSVTVSSDVLGSLKFSGEGGDSAQNALGDTAAGNIWDNFDTRNGADSKLKESRAGNNIMHYTAPEFFAGLALTASYMPSSGFDDADTAVGIAYTGAEGDHFEGLVVSYARGSNDGQTAAVEGSATQPEQNANATTLKMAYTFEMLPLTVAFSDHEYDSALATGTEDQDARAWSVSYTISDEFSVTYAEEEIDSGTAADQDAKYSKLSGAYTSGGMTVSANMQEMENGDYSVANAADEEYVGLSVSFAF